MSAEQFSLQVRLLTKWHLWEKTGRASPRRDPRIKALKEVTEERGAEMQTYVACAKQGTSGGWTEHLSQRVSHQVAGGQGHRTPEEAGRTWGRRALLHDLTRSLSFIFESFSRNITMLYTRDYFTSSFSIFISPLLSLMFWQEHPRKCKIITPLLIISITMVIVGIFMCSEFRAIIANLKSDALWY